MQGAAECDIEAIAHGTADAGRSAPLGATVVEGGVTCSMFSRHATRVELLVFDREADPRPSRVIPVNAELGRTYHYWHAFVPGLAPGQLYGYRAYGPLSPANGLRFDSTKVLLDPYGRGVVTPHSYSRDAAGRSSDHIARAMKSVVVGPSEFYCQGDTPLRRAASPTIIYEMHV